MTEAKEKKYFDFQTTKPVRGVWLTVVTPEFKEFTQNGKKTKSNKPTYHGEFLFPKDGEDLGQCREMAKAALKDYFPDKSIDELKPMLADRFRDGDKLADDLKAKGKNGEYYRGHVVVGAATDLEGFTARGRAYASNGKVIDITSDEQAKSVKSEAFYSGVELYVKLQFKGFQAGNNPPGVTAYLQSVFSLCRGERLAGGGKSAAETFAAYVGLDSKDDPTAGAKDEAW